MTVLELLTLPFDDIASYFIRHGIKSHFDFLNKDKKIDVNVFCDMLQLEKGTCFDICTHESGLSVYIDFRFQFDFQDNVDWSACQSKYNTDLISISVHEDSHDKLNVASLLIADYFTVWAEKNSFFSNVYNNFQYKMEIEKQPTFKETLEWMRNEANKLKTHILYYLSTLKDGTYEMAYNQLHMDMFKPLPNNMDISLGNVYIDTRYDAYRIYEYEMNILELMLFTKYINYDNYRCFKSNAVLDIGKMLENATKMYVITDDAREKNKKLHTANDDFKNRLNMLITEMSEKYGIHESYFSVTGDVLIPTRISNELNLSEPLKK